LEDRGDKGGFGHVLPVGRGAVHVKGIDVATVTRKVSPTTGTTSSKEVSDGGSDGTSLSVGSRRSFLS
jgi:hypothetical protein